jgi:hypothetical protein
VRRAHALALLLLAGCPERRKPIALHGDAGPAVVVVEPNARRPAVPLVQVPLVDEKEPDDDVAHAQPLEPQKGIKGTLAAAHLVKGKSASDEDVYSWTEGGSPADGGTAAHEARITLTGIADVDLVLEALDGDGKRLLVVNDGAAGENEVIPNLGVEPGHTYYVRVKAGGAPPTAETAPYQLVVQSSPVNDSEREPNDTAATAAPLATMTGASGYWGKKRDEDWLKVPVHLGTPGQGGILNVQLHPVDGVAPQLKIFSATGALGTPLASARAQKGEELRLRNVSVPAGTESLLVQLKAAEGKNLDARWVLSVAAEPPLDGAESEPNDTPDKANQATLGQTVSGFLWPGDADVYCVPDEATNLMRVAVEGLDNIDLKLDRVGRDGKVQAHADDGGPGKPEALPPGACGCVRVTARAKDSAYDAPYRLTFTAVPATPDLEREPNESAGQATRWPDGTTAMHGWLAPKGDEDWFRFTAPAGKSKVTASVENAAAATLKLSDENKAPLGPSTGKTSASGPVVAGKSYFVSLKSEKGADALAQYTVTLTFE